MVWGAKFFILDSDFWVILKEKNKKPYLVAMISSVNETWTEWLIELFINFSIFFKQK